MDVVGVVRTWPTVVDMVRTFDNVVEDGDTPCAVEVDTVVGATNAVAYYTFLVAVVHEDSTKSSSSSRRTANPVAIPLPVFRWNCLVK